MEWTKLHLRSSLYYEKAALLPFGELDTEALFMFALNTEECFRIDPDPAQLLGPLLAAGTGSAGPGASSLTLLPGLYAFTQKRARICPEEFVDMAAEMQKDALWERLLPGKTLYLRRLWEDGAPVFQIWRPLSGKE